MEKYSMFKGWKNSIVKMATLPEAIYTFNAIPIKILKVLFCRNIKINPEIHRASQGTPNSQNNLQKEE